MGRAGRGNGGKEDARAVEAQRSFSDDLESKRERARSALQSYKTQPLDDRPMIAEATEDQRKSSMAYSKRYFNEVFKEIDPDKIWTDPDNIWLDLCRGTEHAKNYCQSLLRSYVEESMEKFVVLGPEEYEWRRTVNSASSVTQYWRELIAEADATVLRDKRRKDPENYDKWRLKFLSHTHQRGQGPVFEISQWIFQTLAKELNLAVNLTFEKIEATDEDTVVLLNTLWQRADDIPCRPSTRLSFHGTLLLAAIGGFRRGTIERLRYRDVCLAVVRDPSDRSKTKLVVTPTIGKNKLRRATRVSRAIEISFSMTLVPYSAICLASTVAARAIKDNAFEPSFESVEALLSRPILEETDFLPLKWKEDMLDRPIFHLSDTKFYKLWHRTCLVAGLREDPRFYTMRVGCGGRLDGVLTDALRNYILSNTTGVFQGSYQPKRVREDLMKLAFGPMAGCNDCLFQRLRSMSLSRDADAPVDLSVEDLQGFEKRNDVSNLRASLKAAQLAGDKKEAMSIKSRVEYLVETLSSLKVKELRDAYFDRVDSLRARGLPTVCSSEESGLGKALLKKRGNGSAAAIAEFLQRCTYDVDEGSLVEQRSKVYMNLLVDYLAHRPQPSLESQVPKVERDPTGWQMSVEVRDENDDAETNGRGEQSRCFLCDHSFHGRSELTRHYRRIHVRTFDWPLSCPECLRQGMGDVLIEGGASAWSNHVETVHGKIHAPNLPSYVQPLRGSVQCLLCEAFFMEGGGLTRHILRTHDRKEGRFKQPFPCPECYRRGKGDVRIDGSDAWYEHVASVHGKIEAPYFPSNQPHSPDSLSVDGSRLDLSTGKRKRDDEDMVANFEVEADAAVGSDRLGDTMTTDTAGTTPDAITDAASGTQTPASSVDSDIIHRIDPHLLSDDSRQGRKRLKGNQLDNPEVSDYDNRLSPWTMKLGPIVFGRSESTEQETLEPDGVSSADSQPKDHSSSYTGTPSTLYIDPIDPMILSTDGSSGDRPNITLEQVQEAAETGANPPFEEITISELIPIGHEDASQCGRINENLLSNPNNYEDAPPVRLQSQTEIDGSSTSPQSVQLEKEIGTRPTPAMTPDPEDSGSDIAKLYWGRGYALVPEGSEPNRFTNNAQRRKEISSNISPEHVIKGNRLRTPKNSHSSVKLAKSLTSRKTSQPPPQDSNVANGRRLENRSSHTVR